MCASSRGDGDAAGTAEPVAVEPSGVSWPARPVRTGGQVGTAAGARWQCGHSAVLEGGARPGGRTAARPGQSSRAVREAPGGCRPSPAAPVLPQRGNTLLGLLRQRANPKTRRLLPPKPPACRRPQEPSSHLRALEKRCSVTRSKSVQRVRRRLDCMFVAGPKRGSRRGQARASQQNRSNARLSSLPWSSDPGHRGCRTRPSAVRVRGHVASPGRKGREPRGAVGRHRPTRLTAAAAAALAGRLRAEDTPRTQHFPREDAVLRSAGHGGPSLSSPGRSSPPVEVPGSRSATGCSSGRGSTGQCEAQADPAPRRPTGRVAADGRSHAREPGARSVSPSAVGPFVFFP